VVLVSAPLGKLPLVLRAPLQPALPSLAVQALALLVDQARVLLPP
jgi:hypothetical protein